VLEELELEELVPQHLVGPLADPLAQPLRRLDTVEFRPVVDALGVHDVQGITHLVGEAEVREAQQAVGPSPVVERAFVEKAHLGRTPPQAVRQAELGEHVEQRLVRLADEVVVALDLQSVEVEGGRHPSDAVVRFEQGYPIPALAKLVRTGESHRTRADHGGRFVVVRCRCGVDGRVQCGLSSAMPL
jgi:hypothetical protein